MQRVIRLLAGVFSVALTGLALTLMFAVTPAAAATPSCGDNTGKAATGTPIPIGAVMSNSGIGSFEEAAQAVAAYFKCVNANGGIHGRPIKYIVGDDQSKPDVALQVAKKLVEDDKVYALVGNTSFIECLANSNYYIQQNVLEIGLGIPPQCYQSKNISELNAGPRLSGVGAADYAGRVLGVKSLVCSIVNIPGADYSCQGVEAWGKEHGVKVTSIYTDPVSPDYTSIALQIMATGADAAVVFGTKDTAVQFLSAVQQQDGAAKMKWLGPTSYYSVDFPSAIDAKYWNNRLWVNIELEPLNATGPDNLNWIAIEDAYAGKNDIRDSFSQAGYLAAKITTEAMLTIADPAKIDRATVTAALQNVKNVKTDILCKPWYWGGAAAMRHSANHTTLTATIADGQWKIIEGCTPVPDPELKDVLANEKAIGMQ